MRAMPGTWVIATPITSTHALGPAPVARIRSRMIGGNASSTSMARMSSESDAPREVPATSPMEMPTT
jgi:hypothetical protein